MEPATLRETTFVRRHSVVLGLLLVLLTSFIAYAGTLHSGFAYDDFLQIVYNDRVHSAQFLPGYFTQQVWAQTQNPAANLYRPLFLCWVLINYKAFGSAPFGWHCTSVLLHLLATLLVYLVARRMALRQVPALIAAAIFALHPIHVEAIAWVSGSTEPLYASFFLGSLLCYVESQRGGTRPFAWLLASTALYAGALFAKESAIVLPAVAVVYGALFRPSDESRNTHSGRPAKLVSSLLPYFAILAVYLVARVHALGGFAHSVSNIPMSSALASIPSVLYSYVSLTLVPIALGPFYDSSSFGHSSNFPRLVIPACVLLILTTGIIWWNRKSQMSVPLFCLLWYTLTLAPALAVLLFLSPNESVHDRYLYLPSVALAILAGFAWMQIFKWPATRSRIIQFVLAGGLTALLVSATRSQAAYWRNDFVLFSRAVAIAPHNSLARFNLAAELIRERRITEASTQVAILIAQNPTSPLALTLAAECAYFSGNYAQSDAYYRRALGLGSVEREHLYYFVMSLIRLGKYDEAAAFASHVLSTWPEAPGYHFLMGLAESGMSHWEDAQREYRVELEHHPEDSVTRAALEDANTHVKVRSQQATE